jgi:hypothetical protein
MACRCFETQAMGLSYLISQFKFVETSRERSRLLTSGSDD